MPLTVSFQLSDRDLKYFRDLMRGAKEGSAARDSAKIFESARKLLNEMKSNEVPDFVRERMEKLDLLFQMVEDSEWRLEGQDRSRVIYAMAYLADPVDAIPDQIPGLGFLDDAIMVKFVEDEFKHELWGYRKFRGFRSPEEQRPWTTIGGERLHKRREEFRKQIRAEITERKAKEDAKRKAAEEKKGAKGRRSFLGW